MSLSIRSPQTDTEWQSYYHFRWQQLREPWRQPEGSEKDESENQAWHLFAINAAGTVYGCGRIHQLDEKTGQIRFMAVSPGYQAQGLGKKILRELETIAIHNGMTRIMLNAREQAIGFYSHLGYVATEPSHTLYGSIKHMKMVKQLSENPSA